MRATNGELPCGCCRRIRHLLADERSRQAVEVEGQIQSASGGEEERGAAQAAAQAACRAASQSDLFREPWVFAARAAYHTITRGYRSIQYAADCAARAVAGFAGQTSPGEVQASVARRKELVEQSRLLRCIFGPALFRPLPPVAPAVLAWSGGTLVKLAAGVYEERNFSPDRMGVLADAAEEAGLEDAEVLAHSRSPGPHACGCHVVDLLLGKS